MKPIATAALAGFLLLPVCAQTTPEPSSRGVNFYTLEREIREGRAIAFDLERTVSAVHNQKLDDYFERLRSDLATALSAAHPGEPQFPWRIVLFEDRKPFELRPVPLVMPVDALQIRATEPVAIAGGTILIPMSLVAGAAEEPYLAFQLAHAMAHITLRHGTKEATRLELLQLATVPLQAPPGNAAARMILVSHGASMQAGMALFARTFELQADDFAISLIAGAGYDPETAARYLEPPPDPGVLSAHPGLERRMNAVTAAISRLPARTYGVSSIEFDQIKTIAATVQ